MVMEKSDDERYLQTSVSSIRKDTASSELSTDEEDKENKSEGTESKTQQESDIKPVNRGKHEFVPVDEREFLTVSELVRGRVKLQDVNKFQSNSQRLDKNGTEGYWSNWRSKVKGS